MERVKTYLKRSYHDDPSSFYAELIGTLITVTAAIIMALTAKNPDMTIIYPLWTAGAIISMYTYYRKRLVWTLMLMQFYVATNIIGYTVASSDNMLP
jgi:hypothetical protein